jgi:hypothetical protein
MNGGSFKSASSLTSTRKFVKAERGHFFSHLYSSLNTASACFQIYWDDKVVIATSYPEGFGDG